MFTFKNNVLSLSFPISHIFLSHFILHKVFRSLKEKDCKGQVVKSSLRKPESYVFQV
jgi:hypothetical protein